MLFTFDDIPIYFPYPSISHEQLSYIKEIIRSFKTKNNLMIEMHAGAGKTICLLSAAVSFLIYTRSKQNNREDLQLFEDDPQFIYCTRTVPETEKTLGELKMLINYIQNNFSIHSNIKFLGIGLTSRKHFCTNPKIKHNIEIECRKLLAQGTCEYFERVKDINLLNKSEIQSNSNQQQKPSKISNLLNFSPIVLNGVYTIEEIDILGKERIFCPYFFIRKVLQLSNILVCTFNYILDPQISGKMFMPNNPFIIFDEAHNIDNACIEAFKSEITRDLVNRSRKAVEQIEKIIQARKDKLDEIKNKHLVMDGKQKNINSNNFVINKEKAIFDKDIEEFKNNKNISWPGALRKDIHVVSLIKRIIEFIKMKLKSTHLTINTTSTFLNSMQSVIFSNKKTLLNLKKRYSQMDIPFSEDIDKLNFLIKFIDTLVSFRKSNAFTVIFEPNSHSKTSNINLNPKLTLSCNDSRIAISSIIKHQSLVITSGTLTPFDTYIQLLGLNGRTVSIKNERKNDLLIVTKGNDQIGITSIQERITINKKNDEEQNERTEETLVKDQNFEKVDEGNSIIENTPLSSSFKLRNTPSTIRNYMQLILDLSQIAPDGMIIFFPSYLFMNEIVSQSQSILKIIKKPIFIETVNYSESMNALENYKRSIKNGRGGMFLCVARGKVSEGIDFKEHEGRLCLLIGVPFAYTESVIIRERVRFLSAHLKIGNFLQFDALRHAMQCLGRVIRGKNDYGLIIVADYRYLKYYSILTETYNILESLSTDMAVNYGKIFFRKMANREIVKMLTESDIEKYC